MSGDSLTFISSLSLFYSRHAPTTPPARPISRIIPIRVNIPRRGKTRPSSHYSANHIDLSPASQWRSPVIGGEEHLAERGGHQGP
ncbi:hypothetical protein CEXT_260011 [Caerostris extrusa]|uniref:Uncharacterized protein n=1 Tax=Caerostris extrusa TaxID=172846 RepID=A0AAV4U2C6_CAEEX|nr:hypothetical protein CEXT_260011 [Caerostris extrusa]